MAHPANSARYRPAPVVVDDPGSGWDGDQLMEAGSARAPGLRRRVASVPANLKRTDIPPGLWIESAGGMAALGVQAFAQLVSPGLSWRTEFIRQFIFSLADHAAAGDDRRLRHRLLDDRDPGRLARLGVRRDRPHLGRRAGRLPARARPDPDDRDRRRHARLDDHRRDRRPQDPPGDRGARGARDQPGPQPDPAARRRAGADDADPQPDRLLGRGRGASSPPSSSTARPRRPSSASCWP